MLRSGKESEAALAILRFHHIRTAVTLGATDILRAVVPLVRPNTKLAANLKCVNKVGHYKEVKRTKMLPCQAAVAPGGDSRKRSETATVSPVIIPLFTTAAFSAIWCRCGSSCIILESIRLTGRCRRKRRFIVTFCKF